jgi:hypothetical protein
MRVNPHVPPRVLRRRALGWLAALGLSALLSGHPGAARAAPRACPGPTPHIEAVAPGVWWVPGAAGDATAANRGAISNLLAVRDGRRLWLLGSGPSPAWGRALGCELRRRTGLAVSDVIAPWSRPELVLGQTGLKAARHWAHADVIAAMRTRCPHCIERLRLRLGEAAGELAGVQAEIPTRALHGDQGRLGPWRWWRLQRSADTAVTVWALPRAGLIAAPGLLWSDGVPDLRDATLTVFITALQRLVELDAQPTAGGAAPTRRWLPEQGPWLSAGAPARARQYLEALREAARAAVDGSALETDPPAPLAVGWPEADSDLARDPRHSLNWQRAWREAEAEVFGTPPAASAAEAPAASATGIPK